MIMSLQSPSLINDFADFLGSGPSPDQIVDWHPSDAVVARYEALVARRRDSSLTEEEEKELESFLNSEIVLSLLKARLRTDGRSQP